MNRRMVPSGQHHNSQLCCCSHKRGARNSTSTASSDGVVESPSSPSSSSLQRPSALRPSSSKRPRLLLAASCRTGHGGPGEEEPSGGDCNSFGYSRYAAAAHALRNERVAPIPPSSSLWPSDYVDQQPCPAAATPLLVSLSHESWRRVNRPSSPRVLPAAASLSSSAQSVLDNASPPPSSNDDDLELERLCLSATTPSGLDQMREPRRMSTTTSDTTMDTAGSKEEGGEGRGNVDDHEDDDDDGREEDSVGAAPLSRFDDGAGWPSSTAQGGPPSSSSPCSSLWLFQTHDYDNDSGYNNNPMSRHLAAEGSDDRDDHHCSAQPYYRNCPIIVRLFSSTASPSMSSSQSLLSTQTNASDDSSQSLPGDEEAEEDDDDAHLALLPQQQPLPNPSAPVPLPHMTGGRGGGRGGFIAASERFPPLGGDNYDGDGMALKLDNDATLDTLTESVRSWSLLQVRKGGRRGRPHGERSTAQEANRRVMRALLLSRSSSSVSGPSSSPRGAGGAALSGSLLPRGNCRSAVSIGREGSNGHQDRRIADERSVSPASSHHSVSSFFSIGSSTNGVLND